MTIQSEGSFLGRKINNASINNWKPLFEVNDFSKNSTWGENHYLK